MIESIEALGKLLRQARLDDDAGRMDELIALHRDDRGEFWIRMDEDVLWGARRSVAERVAAHENGDDMRQRLIEIAAGMSAVGIHNARAETWVQSFGAWRGSDGAVGLSDTRAEFEVEPEDGT